MCVTPLLSLWLLYPYCGCSIHIVAALSILWLLYPHCGCSIHIVAALSTLWLLNPHCGCSNHIVAALITLWCSIHIVTSPLRTELLPSWHSGYSCTMWLLSTTWRRLCDTMAALLLLWLLYSIGTHTHTMWSSCWHCCCTRCIVAVLNPMWLL
jgi:hypothetical protein